MFKVYLQSGCGTVKPMYFDLTLDEAVEICQSYNWEWMDENGFVWHMDYCEEEPFEEESWESFLAECITGAFVNENGRWEV